MALKKYITEVLNEINEDLLLFIDRNIAIDNSYANWSSNPERLEILRLWNSIVSDIEKEFNNSDRLISTFEEHIELIDYMGFIPKVWTIPKPSIYVSCAAPYRISNEPAARRPCRPTLVRPHRAVGAGDAHAAGRHRAGAGHRGAGLGGDRLLPGRGPGREGGAAGQFRRPRRRGTWQST